MKKPPASYGKPVAGVIGILTALYVSGSPAYAKDQHYHCLEGSKKPKHSYRELDIHLDESSKPKKFHYESEEGPSLSGSFFGCTAAAARGDKQVAWSEQTNTTSIVFLDSSDKSASRANATIQNTGANITLTFDGNVMYFCGVQATLPLRITLSKKNNTCKFEEDQQ